MRENGVTPTLPDRYYVRVYSTCLFCNASLGANEVIEHFPVGRRLAYDAEHGRLWVVCTSCERWNLSPFESRWEAIEDAERAFRATRVRVSGENIGMARLRDGTELVRIGKPLKLELAVWRYGDQFGRRRRKAIAAAALPTAVGTTLLGLSAIGVFGRSVAADWVVSLGGVSSMLHSVFTMAHSVYAGRKGSNLRINVLDESNRNVPITRFALPSVVFITGPGNDEWKLRVPDWELRPAGRSARLRGIKEHVVIGANHFDVRGEAAARALGAILPHINAEGGSRRKVGEAVKVIEQSRDVRELLQTASSTRLPYRADYHMDDGRTAVTKLPISLRLAMEMSLHEDDERRAMEGELRELEQRWREADTIARIADGLLVPETVREELKNLRVQHREPLE